jgi:aldehyde dehydrogenase
MSVLLVTGGPGVVKEALKTSKKAITAGPGNPPAVVDQTADVGTPAATSCKGASFDNNVICTDEKTTIVVDTVADRLVQAMVRQRRLPAQGARDQAAGAGDLPGDGPAQQAGDDQSQNWIGKDAGRILSEIGVTADEDVRLIVAEVPREHNLVWTEQMMPVMPVVRVHDVDDAIDLAVVRARVPPHRLDPLHQRGHHHPHGPGDELFSIFVANGPNYAGLGEGGEGSTSFSIASPTGEGLTRPRTFSRVRRVTVVGALRIV